MRMNQVRFKPASDRERFEKEEDIKIRLVPGGTCLQLLIPWNGGDAISYNPWNIPADMICHNFYFVS